MSHNENGKGLEKSEENWLVSYADMLTLLLFLFIILYAIQVDKMESIKAGGIAARDAVSVPSETAASSSPSSAGGTESSKAGGTSKTNYTVPVRGSSSSQAVSKASAAPASSAAQSSADAGLNEAKNFVSGSGLAGTVSVFQSDTGVIFEIQAEILFDLGTSQIRSDSYSILDKICTYLSSIDNDILIIGYTDNQPPPSGSPYQSNWELSSDRATKVLRYYTDTKGLIPRRFTAIARGEYQPVSDNSTEAGRQQNRRVDIVVVKKP